jgi:hypothetical protein
MRAACLYRSLGSSHTPHPNGARLQPTTSVLQTPQLQEQEAVKVLTVLLLLLLLGLLLKMVVTLAGTWGCSNCSSCWMLPCAFKGSHSMGFVP